MFCPKCGKEIDDKAIVCIGCGIAVTPKEIRLAAVNSTPNPTVEVNTIQTVDDAPINGAKKKGFRFKISWIFALCSVFCLSYVMFEALQGLSFSVKDTSVYSFYNDTSFFMMLGFGIAASVFSAASVTFAIIEGKISTKGFQFSTLIVCFFIMMYVIVQY